MRPVIGITMGDPAGVGPELCLRALREPSVLDKCVPVMFGDAAVLDQLRQRGFPEPGCQVLTLAEWERQGVAQQPVVVDCAAIGSGQVEPGRVSAACGRAAYTYIDHAIRAALAGRIAGVVTAPINKEALRLAGVDFPGHTEIFTVRTGAKRTCMMLWSETMAVSMVTVHVGYADVPKLLSVERVLDVIELTAEALARLLGRQPRLAVCGLNPHAGEHGLFGQREEERFIEPAVSEARKRGIAVEGPLPPDAAFTPNMRKRFDGYVTLYHDQGHIPFKMLAFETGVNITLGLPIIRTSVDHGTAFDIAWKGVADPRSLFAAIDVATRLARPKSTSPASA
ncbi:MAG: 4-hydroxythreonine-4-phosphate dehydrogenase PdxA [Verrucomicrobiales bacterium]|nr:4-hydroxythreonine-4-phosphate dehydrogenase PdxA [Verrucomicrobiales bacterium]